jgi:fatty-acyl-CoA synthase
MCRFEDVERCGADKIVAAALACAPGPEAAQWVAQAAASGADAVLQARMEAVRATDVAQVLYTAGLSAQPRGAMQRHGALLRNNAYAAECLALSSADRYLSCVPLFTAPGTSYTLAGWLAGAAVVILDEFDPAVFCETVERERITVTFFVDTIVQDLRGFPHVANYDLTSLRTGTGAPLPTASFLWITKMLGVPQLVSVYGMSEASGAVARTRTTDTLVKRSTTHGRPVEGVRLRIADVVTNLTLPSNVVGEICVAGDTVMPGYYKQTDADDRLVDADGWIHTGDLGELDVDGFLIYRGRVKDMIKPGGFNVATQEIEVFLRTWPGVREAVVVGVPDERLGEVPYAFIEAVPGKTVDPEALRAYCKAHVASYKVPRYFEFVEEWPAASGCRIRKPELRMRALAARARAQAREGRAKQDE